MTFLYQVGASVEGSITVVFFSYLVIGSAVTRVEQRRAVLSYESDTYKENYGWICRESGVSDP